MPILQISAVIAVLAKGIQRLDPLLTQKLSLWICLGQTFAFSETLFACWMREEGPQKKAVPANNVILLV